LVDARKTVLSVRYEFGTTTSALSKRFGGSVCEVGGRVLAHCNPLPARIEVA